MALQNAVSVFISSTCYDLTDLRFELGQTLVANGFVVRMSEDSTSAFFVDPVDGSIGSCLTNAESSNVVVCIIDRRYGGVVNDGPLKGLSATHAEVKHARGLSVPKPVFFFVREVAFQEYGHMRKNEQSFQTTWVEPNSETSRRKWFEFVKEVASYPKHDDWSNWCDLFKSVVDLKPLVLKRLFNQFPRQTSILALRPDRLVRVAFTLTQSFSNGVIEGYFQNIGVGPAFDLEQGVRDGNQFKIKSRAGGLVVGAKLSALEQQNVTYGHRFEIGTDNTSNLPNRGVYCKYRNAHGDWFRVESLARWENGKWSMPGPECFFVGSAAVPDLEWNEAPKV